MSNETATNPDQTQTPDTSATPGGKSPGSAGVKEALSQARAMDEQAIANLTAEVIQLRAKVEKNEGKTLEKKPVDDVTFVKALVTLKEEGTEDLKGENPKASPNLSLSGIFGFIPEMTKEQKAQWVPVRDGLRKAYSDVHRQLLGKRKAIFARVTRNPRALVATVARQRKDGTHARVSLAASEPAKAKKAKGPSKGKAKPAQIAGNVPAAGNAANPATV